MNETEFRRIFPHASEDAVRAACGPGARRPKAVSPTPRVRQHSFLQKLEGDRDAEIQGRDEGTPDADHEPEETAQDEQLHPRYRVDVTFRVSDQRKRDGDGMLTSILDSIVRAARRCAEMGP